jgi:hypothetical protein
MIEISYFRLGAMEMSAAFLMDLCIVSNQPRHSDSDVSKSDQVSVSDTQASHPVGIWLKLAALTPKAVLLKRCISSPCILPRSRLDTGRVRGPERCQATD